MSRRKRKVQPTTTEEKRNTSKILNKLKSEGYEIHKPGLRRDCTNVPRPCPFVSCIHNTYLDIEGEFIRFNFPDLEPWEVPEETSCVLDVVSRNPKGMSNEKVSDILGVSREAIRLIEVNARLRLRAEYAEAGLYSSTEYIDWLVENES